MKLGCFDVPLQSIVNEDIVEGNGVDEDADRRERWPWPNNSVEHVSYEAARVMRGEVAQDIPSKYVQRVCNYLLGHFTYAGGQPPADDARIALEP